MAEFVGGEPISVGVDEPITFENKTDTAFNVSCGIVFRKSGLYRVSVVGRHVSVAVEPERKSGRWERHNTYCGDDTSGYIDPDWRCSECGRQANVNEWFMYDLTDFCPNCGADMRGTQNERYD